MGCFLVIFHVPPFFTYGMCNTSAPAPRCGMAGWSTRVILGGNLFQQSQSSGWCLVPLSEWSSWAPLTSMESAPLTERDCWFWIFGSQKRPRFASPHCIVGDLLPKFFALLVHGFQSEALLFAPIRSGRLERSLQDVGAEEPTIHRQDSMRGLAQAVVPERILGCGVVVIEASPLPKNENYM